ncbi:hypothetical protein [Sorangium sp. So ce124]|uniref:hypothetical protein n=1 Tax=Sorangium sp. So ce124 TaxID=3133280 RepID=UPI003F5F368D
MKAPPRFTPPSPPADAPAPFLVIALDAAPFAAVDGAGLLACLKKVTGVEPSKSDSDWNAFARSQHLTIGGHPVLASPNHWFRTESRWFAVAITEAKSEAHLFFGWVVSKGAAAKYTHIDLIKDSHRWASSLPRAATPWWRFLFCPVKCTGYATVGGSESGISLKDRKSIFHTLTDKDAAATFATLLVPIVAAVIKAGDYSALVIAIAASVLLGIVVAHAIIRHLFILPRLSWGVDGLER